MKISRIAAVVLLLSLVAAWLPGRVSAAETTPMYRLYNPNSGEHFYTGSMDERDNLVAVGWNYEGIAWHAPISGGSPVYRVFNPNSGDHHYTMSQDEVDMLVGLGWQYEGVCWNSPSEGNAQYRLWNPNADLGSHHYTNSVEERDTLVSLGWVLEGIGWYGVVEPPHTHNYTATVTAPTCVTGGYTTYSCPCGDTYTDSETAALGHSWSNWTSDDNGSYRSCTACGEQQIVNGSKAQYADDVIAYINEYRVAAGLNPLSNTKKTIGLIRAEEITIQMNHKRLDGSPPVAKECIAAGAGNAKTAVDDWYNSSSHNGIIMNPNATRAIAARCGTCWVIIVY